MLSLMIRNHNHFIFVIVHCMSCQNYAIENCAGSNKKCCSRFFVENLFGKFFLIFPVKMTQRPTKNQHQQQQHSTKLQKFFAELVIFHICSGPRAVARCRDDAMLWTHSRAHIRSHAPYNCCANYNFIKFVNFRCASREK